MNQSIHKKTELLAPAGSFLTLKAVIQSGADAVYAAGNKFGARAYAANFTEEDMKEAIDYSHLHGRKLYLTVNTLLKGRELEEELYSYLLPYYEAGLDAVIVQDLGVLRFIRSHFKGLPIHASTQMTITGALGAKLLQEAGCSRIVTARELSLEEISDIYLKTGVEIESFVHGALCYCYSGQCLMSSILGGRSGNRGRCAQPCRLPYELLDSGKKAVSLNKNESYPLSPKDLCTIELIPELIQSGIHSFKIEGRMKQTEYASGVTAVYRKYLDAYEENPQKPYQAAPKDLQRLLDLGNRNGFTQGYYKNTNGKHMITGGKPSHEKRKETQEEPWDDSKASAAVKEKIKGILILSQDNPAKLVLHYMDNTVEVLGERVEKAQKQPLSAKTVQEKMQKTGNTPFEFQELRLEMEQDVFIPIGSLKELRRRGLEELSEQRLSVYKRKAPGEESLEKKTADSMKPQRERKAPLELRVLTETVEQLYYVLSQPLVTRIYLEYTMFPRKTFSKELAEAVKMVQKAGKTCFLAMPYIFRKHTADWFEQNQDAIQASGVNGYLIRSLEALAFLKKAGIPKERIQGDYGLYHFSDCALTELNQMGAGELTLPVELNFNELMHRECRQSELIIYGHQPLMVSAQCPHKNSGVCDHKKGIFYLKDRFGKLFPNKNLCEDCYNIIYNTSPLSLFHQAQSIQKLNVKGLRLSFTVEGKKEMEQAFSFYQQAVIEGKKLDNSQYWQDFTNGHFKRGVE